MTDWKDRATTAAIIAGVVLPTPVAEMISTMRAPDVDVQQNAQRIAALDATRYPTTQPAFQALQSYLTSEKATRGLPENERVFLLSQVRAATGWLEKHESASARGPMNSIIAFTDPEKEEVLRPGHPRPEAAKVHALATSARDALANDVANQGQVASVAGRSDGTPQR